MAGPWEKYQQKSGTAPKGSGPWDAYGKKSGGIMQQAGDVLVEGAKHAGQNFVGAMGDIDNAIRVFARGATLGGADHLAAKGAELTGVGGPADVAGQQALTAGAKEDLGPVLGNAAELAGAVAPGALIPGAAVSSLPRAMATGATTGIATTTGQTYFDTGDLPSVPEVVVGGMLGAGGGAVGYGLGKLMQRPNLDANTMKQVNLLNQEGIDITAGQATGSASALRREAGATGAADLYESQIKNFSKAALRRAGIIAEDGRLDPTVLDDGFKIVGGQMDKLVANNSIQGPNARPVFMNLLRDSANISAAYKSTVEGGPAKIIDNTYKAIAKAAKRGQLTGAEYQDITSKLEAAARGNPKLAPVAREMRAAIDNGMEEFIKQSNPTDAGLWQAARRRYSNLLVVQDAFTRQGRDAANGLITPANLAAATKAKQGQTRFARGRTDFDDLARAGQAVLRPLPVGQHASPQEIAKMLGRKITTAGMMGGSAMLGGLSPLASGAAALGGMALSEGVEAGLGRMALRPVTSLSTTAAQTGAKAGVAVGSAANPFTRASQ